MLFRSEPSETNEPSFRCGAGWILVLFSFSLAAAPGGEPSASRIVVSPKTVQLEGPHAEHQLLVDGLFVEKSLGDLTHEAEYRSSAPDVATVTETGLLRGLGNGTATITISAAGQEDSVTVQVRDAETPRPLHFENDIIPIFSRFGCNASGCHGKAEGQNGFKLSVFGFDPPADRRALVMEGRGRRVFPPAPAQSLLLLKASGGMPHGGGVRIAPGSAEYQRLSDWIAQGMRTGATDAATVVRIEITPKERQLAMAARQQLRVVATYSDGREEDVTRLARFQTNQEAIANVDEAGRVAAGQTPGEVAIMAAYLGHVDVFRAIIPRPGQPLKQSPPPRYNFIDELVDQKLRKLNIQPSPLCDDATFLRRVHLDLIGTLPTAEEARKFLEDQNPYKRPKLVDRLLKRPEFADYWALQWADLLRVDRLALGHKGAYEFYRWIRDSFRHNKPYDQFVRELVTAEGPVSKAPAGHFYKVVNKPGEMASTISQVFLGTRIECAQCHHHPFDRWSQADYHGMAAFFTQVSFKDSPQGPLVGAFRDQPTKHPRSGEAIFAHALGTGSPEASPAGDRRHLLAEWMTNAENPWLARSLANRLWAHFCGRGLVEPVDDFRLTNPPSNPELLDALAKDFVEHGFDIRHLMQTIIASRTYQLASEPNRSNREDEQNFSRALFKRIDAEVLLDAICQTTGVPEKFEGVPRGSRAIQLWDSQVKHDFLKLFGRPVRATACECERSVEPSVAQVLHVLNSTNIQSKLSHAGGKMAQLCNRSADNAALVEELYLTFYNRFPTAEERTALTKYLADNAGNRQTAVEDIAWSMMNSTEFVFNH